MIQLYTITEDQLSTAVAERLVTECDHRWQVGVPVETGGSGKLFDRLPQYLKIANSLPVLLLTDLDRLECAPALVQRHCPARGWPEQFLFRVAVREVESWLLADHEGFSDFTGIPKNRLVYDCETIADPKQKLLNLVHRYASRDIKVRLVARHGGGLRPSTAYNLELTEYVNRVWQPARAEQCSDSLRRARQRLAGLAHRIFDTR